MSSFEEKPWQAGEIVGGEGECELGSEALELTGASYLKF
jgi:hypothetical protein